MVTAVLAVVAAASSSSPSAITTVGFKAVRRVRLGETTSLRVGAGMARIQVSGTSYDTATVPIKTATGGFTASLSVARAPRPSSENQAGTATSTNVA